MSKEEYEKFGQVDKEKKQREISEIDKKHEIARTLEYQKDKEKLIARIEKDKNLSFLKSLIERGLIETSTVQNVIDDATLDEKALAEIFSKLDEIEATHQVDMIFPKTYRISKEEYIQALKDPTSRTQILTKLETSLVFIYDSLHPNATMGILDFFSGFMHILDKNLIKIQEHTIDIKRSLE
jgi:hypothetical protein